MKRIILVILALAMVIPATSFAQDDTPPEQLYELRLTEEQINDSWRVDNPRRRRINNILVDLKAPDGTSTAAYGTAIVSGDYTTRHESYAFTFTYAPYIDDMGNIRWHRINGSFELPEASETLLKGLDRMVEGWLTQAIAEQVEATREDLRNRTPRLRVLDLVITETDVTISYTVNPIRTHDNS